MLSHIIVFVVLSILSGIAVHAAGKPISKIPPAHLAPSTDAAQDSAPKARSPR